MHMRERTPPEAPRLSPSQSRMRKGELARTRIADATAGAVAQYVYLVRCSGMVSWRVGTTRSLEACACSKPPIWVTESSPLSAAQAKINTDINFYAVNNTGNGRLNASIFQYNVSSHTSAVALQCRGTIGIKKESITC